MPNRIVATGNLRKHISKAERRRREEAERMFDNVPADLECPPDLKGVARETWESVAAFNKSLEKPYLNDFDKGVLYCYCIMCELQNDLIATLNKTTDYASQSKLIKEILRCGTTILNIAKCLGLTPMDRARLIVPRPKEKKYNPIFDFLNDGRHPRESEYNPAIAFMNLD